MLGTADGGFLLSKEKRTSNTALLEIAGRDQQDQKLHLVRDQERLLWTLEKAETELWTEPTDPLLEAVAGLVNEDSPTWQGTATSLVDALGVKRIRIHDLRHSHISLLIDMGYSPVAIADRVGHESIHITLNYAHLFPTTQTDMASKLNSFRGEVI